MVKPLRCYEVPSGKVRCRFVRTLGEDLKGVRDRRWNSEQFIVFQNVILKQARDVTASQAIRRQIEKLLYDWGDGKHVILVKDTL